jgi:hypothetical protein
VWGSRFGSITYHIFTRCIVYKQSGHGYHSWYVTINSYVLCLYDRETHIMLPYIVEQELLAIPEHLRSPSGFSAVRVVDSLVFCVVFCRHSLSFFSFLFSFYGCLSIFRFKTSWLSPFDVFEVCKMGTFNIEPLFAIMKHKIQIYNKNVYLLHVIAYSRGFNFIKGNPYKNYTDKNHFVSKRIQNRKKYVF